MIALCYMFVFNERTKCAIKIIVFSARIWNSNFNY